MAIPDVRVRLTAEGEAQVVGALRRVVAESQKSGRAMSSSFGGLNASLSNLRGLLVQLAAAASVGALVAFTKSAAEAADQVGKMSQSVGASVKNLSAVRAAALTANVGMEQLQAGLILFNRKATEALAGGEKAAKAFRAIGISLDQIRGKDAAERLALLSEAFVRLKDSPEKTALAFEFFGRQAGALIPLLNDLGEVGMAGAIQRAEELGIAFSEDAARGAQAINDDFTILKAQAQSLAIQFVEGLAPAVHAALGFVQKDLADSAKNMKSFGQVVGQALAVGFIGFEDFVDRIVTSIRKLFNAAQALGRILVALATAPLTVGAVAFAEERVARALNAQLEAEFKARQEGRLQKVEDVGFAGTIGAASLPKLRSGVGDTDAPIIPEEKTEKKKTGKSAEQLAFERAIVSFQAEQNALDFEGAKIQEQVNAGVLSQFDAQQRLLALDKERLPVLRQLAEAALAAAQALGDPAAIERARELGRTVELMAIQVESTGQVFRKLGATIKDTLVSSLTEFFSTGIREAKNFGDAIRGLATTLIAAIQQVLAAELAAAIVKRIVRGFSAGGSVGGEAEPADFATGGYVRGPGTGVSDSIPAMLSNGEFVVRSSVVERPGMLSALSQINSGSSTPALSGSTRARRYADGGLVSGAGNSRLESSLTIGLEPGLVVRDLQSPEGERAVVRIIGKNRRAAGAALGS